MKLFKDPDGKEEIEFIHFGKVKVGETKEIIIYLKNDSQAILSNLIYEFPKLPSTEVLKVDGPITIQPGKIETLKLSWKPSFQFKRALTVNLSITGEEIYLAETTILMGG